MKYFPRLLVCSLFPLLAASCTPIAPTPQAAILQIQYTFAAQPWLGVLYDCSGENVIEAELRAVDFLDLNDADMVMQIGEKNFDSSAYQIGTEEILVVVHPQNQVDSLTSGQVLGLFTGSIRNWQEVGGLNAPVQVWVFPAGEDIQQVFTLSALGGSPVTSLARLAPGPEVMSQAIAEDINAIGILTRQWLIENVTGVYMAVEVPVLMILPDEPLDATAGLLTCLQK